jgi:hypothetical protein
MPSVASWEHRTTRDRSRVYLLAPRPSPQSSVAAQSPIVGAERPEGAPPLCRYGRRETLYRLKVVATLGRITFNGYLTNRS